MKRLRGLWHIFSWGLVLGIPGLLVYAVVFLPFGQVDFEFGDLAGPDARQRIESRWPGEQWPEAIDAVQVRKVSCKYSSQIDWHTTWWKIELAPRAASAWQDDIHTRAEQAANPQKPKGSFAEGIRRIVHGQPPLRDREGTMPGWWSPTAIDFRATEVMQWSGSTGYGLATYSAYDETSGTLWICEYGHQHEILWPRGKLPDGERLATTEPAVGAAPVAPTGDAPAEK